VQCVERGKAAPDSGGLLSSPFKNSGPVELTRLALRNFRNLASLDLDLPPAGVVIIGDNGQGKTNLLEAIYYLVLFRSLRGAKDRELVRFGEQGFFVGGQTDGRSDGRTDGQTDRRTISDARVTAGYELAGRKKKVSVDGAAVSRLSDAVGRVVAVPFAPSDRSIVSGPGSGRRRYLDVMLSLSARGYLTRLGELRLALRQRNAALRRGRGDEAQAFNRALAEAAAPVVEARTSWVARWSARFAELTTALGEHSDVRMRYRTHRPPTDDPGAQLVELLPTLLSRDLRRGATTAGPHRDDLELTLEGRELRNYGSAGQQRTAAIALRLLEAETLTQATGTAPVGLYDDVFAELDEERQCRLLQLIHETLPGQAIVTAPRENEVPEALLNRPRWRMKGGRIGS
jgi:DNA replication and repair protein RecF